MKEGAKRVICLTGTPALSRPIELFTQLEALGTVSPGAIAEAKTQSDEIFNRFKATLDDAARAATAPTRMVCKTTPVQMQEAPIDHRFRGKQVPKKFITDHFKLVKKSSGDKRRSFSVPPRGQEDQ